MHHLSACLITAPEEFRSQSHAQSMREIEGSIEDHPRSALPPPPPNAPLFLTLHRPRPQLLWG